MASRDLGAVTQNGQPCEVCAKLNLTIEKFVPARLEGADQLPGVLGNTFDPLGLDGHSLGYLDEIYRRRLACPFCRLLFEATHSQGEQVRIGLDGLTEDGKRIACGADWILDGRLLDDNSSSGADYSPRTTNPSRRLRIFSPDGTFPDAYVVPLQSTLPGAEFGSVPTFMGRLIPRAHVDIKRLKSWLDLCTSTHHAACKPPSRMIKIQGLAAKVARFIDLQEERLVEPEEMPDEFEYATVSYVWGTTYMAYRLVTARYDEFRQHLPVRSEAMQKTLRDVMAVVDSLGIRYIWVDALCIIQDNSEDWERTAPLMEELYGNGKVNICAAAGSDAYRGVPGSVHTPRTTQQPVTQCFGLDLIAVKPVESRIRYTKWNSRAWTFQERMLSPRSLIFVEDRVFWQCRQATWSEEVDSESSQSVWNLDMVDSPLHLLSSLNPVRQFTSCVELYSARKMAFRGDKLIAFRGLEGLLGQQLKSTFLYGLPLTHLDWALLWDTADSNAESYEWDSHGCLHYWSLSGFFQLSRKTMSTDTFKPELQEGLHRFGILDSSQNWCGTVVLDKSWFQLVGGICEFVAISEARDFSMEELDTWNYYVPEEREASEWNLYYAFLVENDSDSGTHRRRGLAKLYQSAFDRGSFAPKTGWREFFLA
ncbi:hypothetical protein KJ359_001923 [Pestalotiopsis sp. 9143b]|nr:hypothetical protein KJ359_001923 [Pestalotiopsis sp. 9143b]